MACSIERCCRHVNVRVFCLCLIFAGGSLLVLCGPSGVGKSTLVKRLLSDWAMVDLDVQVLLTVWKLLLVLLVAMLSNLWPRLLNQQ